MTPLKKIDLNAPCFEANGKTYYIESALSIERYCEFQQYEQELAYGVSFPEMLKKQKEIYNLLNKQELVRAAVLVDGIVKGIAKVPQREPVVLKICALFINEENEDRSQWSQDLVVKKIEDWKKEGIEMASFFGLALNSVSGLFAVYNKITQAISENKDASAISAIMQ